MSYKTRASANNIHSYFVLNYLYSCKTTAELAVKRAPLRPLHLAHATRASDAGLLVLGGAFGDEPTGALLLFRTAQREQVEAWVREDPYVVRRSNPS